VEGLLRQPAMSVIGPLGGLVVARAPRPQSRVHPPRRSSLNHQQTHALGHRDVLAGPGPTPLSLHPGSLVWDLYAAHHDSAFHLPTPSEVSHQDVHPPEAVGSPARVSTSELRAARRWHTWQDFEEEAEQRHEGMSWPCEQEAAAQSLG
jgi:hypothetical protein